VKVRIIGLRRNLSGDLRALLNEAEELTRGNSGLTLVVAFNYGARQEIVEAARGLALEAAAGRLDAATIDEAALGARLDTAGIPDPDLVIRTSGEQRLSNFLLWQAAYAEFVFLPMHWPDFDHSAFQSALAQYAARERRFGGTAAAPAIVKSAS
jgi:undecaprenyl diphosphate synthase